MQVWCKPGCLCGQQGGFFWGGQRALTGVGDISDTLSETLEAWQGGHQAPLSLVTMLILLCRPLVNK